MDLDIISQYLISIIPAVTAVITAVAGLVISVKRIKDTSSVIFNEQSQIEKLCSELLKENRELKKVIKTKIDKIAEK